MGFFDKNNKTKENEVNEPTPTPKTTTLDALLSRAIEGHKTMLDIDTDKAGRRDITFSLQRLPDIEPEIPPRAETPARAHAFYEAQGFARYLARYGMKGDLVVYADPESEKMWATLAEKAEGGVETVVFAPQLHPLWKPWSELIAAGRMSLERFRDFVNQHRRAVSMPPGRALALMLSQIRAAVEVTVHDGRGKNALNGIVIRTNIQGTEAKEQIDLPEELMLRVPLYVGGEVQNVELDLVVDADAQGHVTVLVAAGGVEEARVFAFDSMLASIREILKDSNATIAYGEPARIGWSYLPARAKA